MLPEPHEQDHLYIATRRDLSPGMQAAQAAHAAVRFALLHPRLTAHWRDSSEYLVILAVRDEPALRRLYVRATHEKLLACAFYEPDLGDELTAIALQPGYPAQVLCADLPLALRGKGLRSMVRRWLM